jgi:hypothetical protein
MGMAPKSPGCAAAGLNPPIVMPAANSAEAVRPPIAITGRFMGDVLLSEDFQVISRQRQQG